ncbi:class I SAM-dependent methyltransferase [Qipengyuania sphaerica]|uniref:class I SAM-dependent methyltransferase n=1 Tax=Qipengyuania sphaerica TaxID=2867243 RepID=UPI001C87E925|nr:hypothetical protein [Qipengyuania sphaerica]MBX7539758.1 hypothetical protein [Qipengyuania sphaerica]
MRIFMSVAAAAAMMATPLAADDHAPDLDEVLAADLREDDRARDRYRNPAETLKFFGIEPTMTVAELNPGGGWYTRVLAPYLLPHGKYIALAQDSGTIQTDDRARLARALGWTERFKADFAEEFGVDAASVHAYEVDELPEEVLGTVDMLLAIRTLHGAWNAGTLLGDVKRVRPLLKDGGVIGVVQHRAPADASYDDVNPARGYMREADVVKLMELAGFELVRSSDINANPNDPADWEGGVWTLPPTLRYGDQDRDRYLAIGESDRMTLLFRKAD